MSTYLQTGRSPLNSSRSKQLYSIPKAHRFTSSSYVSPAPYYDNKISSLGKRATSFGYGQKFTLESKAAVPSPNLYGKKGYFEDNMNKRKGYSFSHDRKKSIVNEEEVRNIPGPGNYNFKADKSDFRRVSYSFRGKYEDPLQKHKSAVGPGQYSTIGEMNSQGKYFVDKYPSSGCPKIGNSKRFNRIESISPGPGKYEDTKVTGFNNSGTYFCSTFRTSKGNAFAHGARKHIAQPTIAPGPGAYNSFSDFPRAIK